MKEKLILIAKISVSLIAILLLFYMMRSSLKSVLDTLKSINIMLFAVTILAFFLVVILMSYRFQQILFARGIKISLKDAVKLNFIAYFFNNFFITSIGGDIVKAYMIAQDHKAKKVEPFAAVIIDRVAGLVSLLSISVVSLVFGLKYIENKIVIWFILGVVLGSIALMIMLINKNIAKKFTFIINRMNLFDIKSKIKKLYLAVHDFKYHKDVMLRVFVISVVLQVLSIILVYMLAKSIYVSSSLAIFFIMMPLISLLSMIPSLNGLGIREGSFVYLLGNFIGKPQAFSLSLLWLAVLILSSIVGGILYMLRLKAGHKLKMSEVRIRGD